MKLHELSLPYMIKDKFLDLHHAYLEQYNPRYHLYFANTGKTRVFALLTIEEEQRTECITYLTLSFKDATPVPKFVSNTALSLDRLNVRRKNVAMVAALLPER